MKPDISPICFAVSDFPSARNIVSWQSLKFDRSRILFVTLIEVPESKIHCDILLFDSKLSEIILVKLASMLCSEL